MRSTMQTLPLSIVDLFEYGERTYPGSRITDYVDGQFGHRTFGEVAEEARRLASALGGLGVGPDDVVATLCWNSSHHVAAYFAVPNSGAILHTLNLRLHPSQLAYIAGHAGDKVILVDADLVPLLAEFIADVSTVTDVVVIGHAAPLEVPSGVRVHSYADLVAGAQPRQVWPAIVEEQAAGLCYTTGTTGVPKGVAYSHRSTYLHTLMISAGSVYGFSDADCALPVVPMFHANAWGWVYAAWIAGSDLVMSGRFLQAPHLGRMVQELRPTMMAAVPTIWSALSRHAAEEKIDLTCLRLAISGGSPLSPALAREVQENNGLLLLQGWGMTETSPLLTISTPPAATPEAERANWTTRTGRLVPGVQARIVADDGQVMPCDGRSQGEVEVAGNTIAGAYYGSDDDDGSKFRDGWLRTGDLGVIHPGGWVQLKDRLKDGIKSGGEWISTVELENAIADHPEVLEVAVVGIPDPRWEERPHAFVVTVEGSSLADADLAGFLAGRVAKWWIPERWTFTADIPKTSVGKIDKAALRKIE